MALTRRRCTGVGCGKPIVMEGPKQSGVYFTGNAAGGTGIQRTPLCWDCYDNARGNPPRSGAKTRPDGSPW